MFSRNNNSRENYVMEQKRNMSLIEYRFFDNSPNGPAYTTHLQGNGLGIANLHPRHLSENYLDIDSFLKGIGSSNFIEPAKDIRPIYRENTFLHIHQREPVLLPNTFHPYPKQRPCFT
jgi:hypothetical protein